MFCFKKSFVHKTIFLLGFMGSGKTFWGLRLAKRLDLPFVDLDLALQTGENRSIGKIFEENGESGFRVLELEYLHRMAQLTPCVLATGGGTPCFFDNMAWMNAHGTTVYLKTPVDVLLARLRLDQTVRPLLQGVPEHDLEAHISRLLAQREPVYEQARIIMPFSADNDTYEAQLLTLIGDVE